MDSLCLLNRSSRIVVRLFEKAVHVRAVCTAAGLIARLCNTLVVAASMAAVSESLAVGKRLGVDSKVLTQVRCWLAHSAWVGGSIKQHQSAQ
jgi:3-hydroxyisobutyrate dehydrogenase-like beta-hydroxyacid dehydrogenase